MFFQLLTRPERLPAWRLRLLTCMTERKDTNAAAQHRFSARPVSGRDLAGPAADPDSAARDQHPAPPS
jgi:hypothetical protein